MALWFCGWKKTLFFQRCQRSFWQSSYHSMSNCSSSRNDLDFFSFHRVLRNKSTPSHALICLGGVLLGGGSTWTERALPEDYGMRGGEMSECVSVFVLCSSVCDEGGGAGAEGLGGGSCNFSQNGAIVSKIEQSRVASLIVRSIHYLLCSCLSLSHRGIKSVFFPSLIRLS